MKVIKRDGSTVDFDRNKIIVAIGKANEAVDFEDRITEAQIGAIVDDIASRHRRRMLVEDRTSEVSAYESLYSLPLRARAHS